MTGPAGLDWSVRPPPTPGEPPPDWLVRLREFRAEVLHADGLRPAYRLPDGTFADPDPGDLVAHHVLVRDADDLVGALRVIPLAATRAGFCERLVGSAGIEQLLAALDAQRADIGEASGWAVAPQRRSEALGPRVLAAGVAVAQMLGLPTTVGAVGRRYGQLYRALAAGFCRAPGFDLVEVAALSDDLQLMFGRYEDLRPGFRSVVDQATEMLQWEPLA